MADGDGCLSLISRGWREVTTAHKKQEQLENQIKEVRDRLLQLAQGWYVNADSNIDREQRKQCAERVLDWLTSNPQAIYDRVQVLEKSLGFEDGDQYALSDFADIPVRTGVGRPEPLERRFAKKLQEYLHEWATADRAADAGRQNTAGQSAGRAVAGQRGLRPVHPLPPRCPAGRPDLRADPPAAAEGRQPQAPRRSRQTPRPPQVRRRS